MGKKKNKPVALLIDADIVAYRSSACIEERSIEVKHIKSGRLKSFKTRTEFKEFLKSKDFPYEPEQYEITDIQTPEPVGHACKIVKNMLEGLSTKLKPSLVHVILGGKGNFRDDLPLPTKYKSNRADFIRPVHLAEVREYLQNVHKAELVEGFETDDAVIFYGYEYLKLGYDVVVATIDKDAQAYSGLKTFDFTKDNEEPRLIPEFGSLWITDKGDVKGNGFIWYCFQHLRGDPTDGFCPYELSGQKFGEKAAYNLLKDCKNEKEALEKVIQQFRQWYPESITYQDWKGETQTKDAIQIADMYFKCCRMMETRTDMLNFIAFAERYGVKI